MDSHFPTFRRVTSHFPTFQSMGGEGRSFAWIWPRVTTGVQKKSLLRLIATATEERLPLIPLLEAWAMDERGIQRSRLQRLIRSLKEGASLPDAVEQVPGVLGDEGVLTTRFGSESGMLAPMIREALDETGLPVSSIATSLRKTLIYVAAMAVAAFCGATFLLVWVAPKYQMILDDFALEAPGTLKLTIQLGELFLHWWFVPVLFIIAALLFVFSARRGRLIRNGFSSRWFRSLRDWRVANLVQKISIALRVGRPISGSISTLARFHFDPALRHKLLFVRNELEQGAELWESMAAVNLLTPPELVALNTAEPLGNSSWVLRQLARARKRRTLRRLRGICSLLMPLMVFALAAFVLVQALSYLLPLLNMIVFQA